MRGATLTLFLAGACWADRAQDLASQAASQQAVNCDSGLTSDTCHAQNPTGCTNAKRLEYDPYLNFLKNQTLAADVVPDGPLNDGDFQSLEEQTPSDIGRNNHADFANDLANLHEGNIFAMVGYLYFAEDTGRTTRERGGPDAKGETCNCQLKTGDSFDFHLGIGFDALFARRLRNSRIQPDTRHPGTMEQTSIVAEMTPHTRHPTWTFARVSALRGKQVKVVGQLMLDNMHFNQREDCGFADALSSCWRGSAWEIHPVAQFFVCRVSGSCDKNSPDSEWIALDDLP